MDSVYSNLRVLHLNVNVNCQLGFKPRTLQSLNNPLSTAPQTQTCLQVFPNTVHLTRKCPQCLCQGMFETREIAWTAEPATTRVANISDMLSRVGGVLGVHLLLLLMPMMAYLVTSTAS